MIRNYRVLYTESVMRLDVSKDDTLKLVMVAPVAHMLLTNVVPGRLYVFLFEQSATTPVTTFYCPQMLNQAPINPQRSSTTVQVFVGLDSGDMAASMVSSYARAS